ncbi:hypothetical protein MB818_05750 [Ruegeria sp. 1NDH52C]|uniref:Uncharacterized protein n=1 Tax=Ruegeria alba TaxID=2916756 RepID=A0ABS9NTZ5_9RHOB|nr:hypothetical protein [Ruegeria alba]
MRKRIIRPSGINHHEVVGSTLGDAIASYHKNQINLGTYQIADLATLNPDTMHSKMRKGIMARKL